MRLSACGGEGAPGTLCLQGAAPKWKKGRFSLWEASLSAQEHRGAEGIAWVDHDGGSGYHSWSKLLLGYKGG